MGGHSMGASFKHSFNHSFQFTGSFGKHGHKDTHTCGGSSSSRSDDEDDSSGVYVQWEAVIPWWENYQAHQAFEEYANAAGVLDGRDFAKVVNRLGVVLTPAEVKTIL